MVPCAHYSLFLSLRLKAECFCMTIQAEAERTVIPSCVTGGDAFVSASTWCQMSLDKQTWNCVDICSQCHAWQLFELKIFSGELRTTKEWLRTQTVRIMIKNKTTLQPRLSSLNHIYKLTPQFLPPQGSLSNWGTSIIVALKTQKADQRQLSTVSRPLRAIVWRDKTECEKPCVCLCVR